MEITNSFWQANYDTDRRRPAPGVNGADDLGATDCAVEVANAVRVYREEGEVNDN